MPGGKEDNIKVAVRCRPMNKREKELKCKTVVNVDPPNRQIFLLKQETNTNKPFTFDFTYAEDVRQAEVYQDIGYPLVESVIEGYNGTVFAYGQTGCGKTFSMEGVPSDPELRGIIPNSFEHIFDKIASSDSSDKSGTKYLVRAGYIEIYNEQIRDLLSSNPLESCNLRQDPNKGVYVENLTMVTVKSSVETMKLMTKGQKSRVVASTEMNAVSSRSHAIFMVRVETSIYDPVTKKNKIKAGKLNLVDLAGSERQTKTKAAGARLKEATKINLSLTALGNVISALVDASNNPNSKVHVPYRDSKLTRLLQDSLGGNTKTVMVACVSPAADNYDETLSTLRYANRAKNIKNKPKINEDPKDALLKKYQNEIKKLKEMLKGMPMMMNMQQQQVPAQAQAVQQAPAMLSVVSAAAASSDSSEKTSSRPGIDPNILKEKEIEFEKIKAQLKASEQEKQQLKESLAKQEQELKHVQNNVENEKKQNENVNKQKQQQIMEQMMEQVYLLESELLEGNHSESHKNKLDEMIKQREMREEKRQQQQQQQSQLKQSSTPQTDQTDQTEQTEQTDSQLQTDTKIAKHSRFDINQRDEMKEEMRYYSENESLKQEISDLNHEFELEKQEMLDDMRLSYREMCLYRQIANLLLPLQLIDKIISQSKWNDDNEMWKLPSFVNDIKKVTFEALANRNKSKQHHHHYKHGRIGGRERGGGGGGGYNTRSHTRLQTRSQIANIIQQQQPSRDIDQPTPTPRQHKLTALNRNIKFSPANSDAPIVQPKKSPRLNQMTPIRKSPKTLKKLIARPRTAAAVIRSHGSNDLISPLNKSMSKLDSLQNTNTNGYGGTSMKQSKKDFLSLMEESPLRNVTDDVTDARSDSANESVPSTATVTNPEKPDFLSLIQGIDNVKNLNDINMSHYSNNNENDAFEKAQQSNVQDIMNVMQGFAQIELTEKDNAKALFHQTMFELDEGDFIPHVAMKNASDSNQSKTGFDLSSLDISSIENKQIKTLQFEKLEAVRNGNVKVMKTKNHDAFLNAINNFSPENRNFSELNVDDIDDDKSDQQKTLPIDEIFQKSVF